MLDQEGHIVHAPSILTYRIHVAIRDGIDRRTQSGLDVAAGMVVVASVTAVSGPRAAVALPGVVSDKNFWKKG